MLNEMLTVIKQYFMLPFIKSWTGYPGCELVYIGGAESWTTLVVNEISGMILHNVFDTWIMNLGLFRL